MTERIEWPAKTRELHNHHFDSTIWNDLVFRDDDIVVSTYAKAGTTWMQQILGQLIFAGDPELEVAEMSPWLDLRVPPKEVKLPIVEAQTHRRFLKTHLPVDALRFSPKAKYIYIGRDGRDVVWSMYNHHVNANETWYQALNDTPGRVGPPIERPPGDIRRYWRDWMDRDGHPFWPFWDNVRSWWRIRGLPNVRFVHFANLKRDMPAEIRRIASFLEIPIYAESWPAIVEHCSFEWMKRNATKSVPLGGAFWDAGAEVFINKGVNGRWRDTLTAAESAEYEERAEAELGAECARWLATGEGLDVLPACPGCGSTAHVRSKMALVDEHGSCRCQGDFSLDRLLPEHVREGVLHQFVAAFFCDRCGSAFVPEELLKLEPQPWKLTTEGWRPVNPDGSLGPPRARIDRSA